MLVPVILLVYSIADMDLSRLGPAAGSGWVVVWKYWVGKEDHPVCFENAGVSLCLVRLVLQGS